MSRLHLIAIFPLVFLKFSTLPASAAPKKAPVELELLNVSKVWDQGPHNAFTDLIRFNGAWWLTFREADEHGVPEPGKQGGHIRVLRSTDGILWESAALLGYGENQDLRDPKLSVTPGGQLMLLCAAAPQASPQSRQSLAYFSDDGVTWSAPHQVGERDFWLWRVTWHREIARGIGYHREGDRRIARLYESHNGTDFQILVDTLYEEGYPNEASLLFFDDDQALCLLRRDGSDFNSGLLGKSSPPYRSWEWIDLEKRIGGPAFIRLPSGTILAATRLYDGQVRTALSWLDPEQGALIELLALPSGGDNSYPGLVWHEGVLWVSYYSSHEGKSSIYLAQVAVRDR